jgi:hypothetical protein
VNENLSVSPTTETPSYERFFGEPSKLIWNLRTFGEMAVATTRLKIQGKNVNKGKYGMFVGYAPNHAPDVYRILKMENQRIVMSRDIRWLRKHYFQWSQGQDDIDDEEMATIEQIEIETEGDNNKTTIAPATEIIEDETPMAEALSTKATSRPPSENAKLI